LTSDDDDDDFVGEDEFEEFKYEFDGAGNDWNPIVD